MLIRPRKNYTKITNAKYWLGKYPKLYDQKVLTKSEKCFVSDTTYVKSKEEPHYLSIVTDACSRKIMGYHLGKDMSGENVVKAPKMIKKNLVSKGQAIHHSDRGLQYCLSVYQKALKK